MNARARFEPGRGDDHGVDHGTLDAVVHRRLVPLVDDPDGHEHHAGADVEAAREQEVDVGLFQLDLAGLFEACDKRVLEFELADEADALGELVGHEKDEAVEIQPPVFAGGLVVVEVHVAGESGRRGGRGRRSWRWIGSLSRGGYRHHGEEQGPDGPGERPKTAAS